MAQKAVQPLARTQRPSAARRLIEMLGFDYFTLLDLLTIARSRKHIEKYYGTAETGGFPDAEADQHQGRRGPAGEFRSIRDINNEIRRLQARRLCAPPLCPAQSRRPTTEVQHRDSRRRGLLSAGRPRGEPDPPAARERPQAHGKRRPRSPSRWSASIGKIETSGAKIWNSYEAQARIWRRSTSRTWTSTTPRFEEPARRAQGQGAAQGRGPRSAGGRI